MFLSVWSHTNFAVLRLEGLCSHAICIRILMRIIHRFPTRIGRERKEWMNRVANESVILCVVYNSDARCLFALGCTASSSYKDELYSKRAAAQQR